MDKRSPLTSEPRVRALRFAAGSALAVLLTLLAAAPTALAGSYQVQACEGAPQNANNSWVAFNTNPAYLLSATGCTQQEQYGGPSPGTTGLSASDVLRLTTNVPAGSSAGWTFTAPLGTVISAFTIDRDLYKRGDQEWHLYVSAQPVGGQLTEIPGQDCTIDPNTAYQCETFGTLSESGLNDAAIQVGFSCPTDAPCVNGLDDHDVRADLDVAKVTLADATPPSAPTAGGPATTSYQQGSTTLSVSASDPVGIASVALANGSTQLATATLPCDYTKLAPCPQASSVPLQFDTAQLPDGVDALTLAVTDTAQNTTTSTINVLVANHAPAAPRLSGAPADWTAQASATITALVPSGGVPISTLDWMLCSASCGPATAVPVPAGATSVTFNATAPSDGAYTIQAHTVDAAGQASATASEPFDVARTAPPAPVALGATAAPGGPISARWSDPAHAAPLTTSSWQLCPQGHSCGAATSGPDSHTLTIPAAPGSYTLRVWLGDAAGNNDPATAAQVAVTVPAAAGGGGAPPGSTGGASSATVTLPANPNASVTLPVTVGHHGVRLLLKVRRRTKGRIELIVDTKPASGGRLNIHLSFAGHATHTYTLSLHRGAAAVTVPIPGGATKLTVRLAGLGAKTTRYVHLAQAARHKS